jgi:ATP-dependent Clp endopeptidase proteolytic subunit ClpP
MIKGIDKMDMQWSVINAEDKTADDDNDPNDNDRVTSANNRIYFYSEVSRPKILTLNKTINSVSTALQNRANSLKLEDPGKIFLHINSYGGSVFAGFSATDYILKSPVDVVTVIDGCAASAATLMSVVGSHRMIHKHSFMLVHQLSSWLAGKYAEMQDDMKNNDLLMKTIKDVYEEHTKIPKAQLSKILKHDLWWDADKCLKYGLVDEII